MAGISLIAAALVYVVAIVPSPPLGEEFRNEAGGFRLRVPEDWVTRQYEPTSGQGVYLGSHEPLLLGRWRRAGQWVARCDRRTPCGPWNGKRFAPDAAGDHTAAAFERTKVDGHEAVRREVAISPPGLVGYAPGLSIRVVEYYVVGDDHIYQFGYWSYPPHLADAAIEEYARTFQFLP